MEYIVGDSAATTMLTMLLLLLRVIGQKGHIYLFGSK